MNVVLCLLKDEFILIILELKIYTYRNTSAKLSSISCLFINCCWKYNFVLSVYYDSGNEVMCENGAFWLAEECFPGPCWNDRNKFVEKNNIAEYQPFLKMSPPMSFSFLFFLWGYRNFRPHWLLKVNAGWQSAEEFTAIQYALMLGSQRLHEAAPYYMCHIKN